MHIDDIFEIDIRSKIFVLSKLSKYYDHGSIIFLPFVSVTIIGLKLAKISTIKNNNNRMWKARTAFYHCRALFVYK